MGNCISNENLCNQYIDTSSHKRNTSKSIEVFFERTEADKIKNFSDSDSMKKNVRGINIKFDDIWRE